MPGVEYSMKPPLKITLVAPCHCAEGSIRLAIPALASLLVQCMHAKLATTDSGIIFVDDGSAPGAWQSIVSAHAALPLISGLRLSPGSGRRGALAAGLAAAKGDFVIVLDADSQCDLFSIVPDMIREAQHGNDIVHGEPGQKTKHPRAPLFAPERLNRAIRFLGFDPGLGRGELVGMTQSVLKTVLCRRGRSFLLDAPASCGFRTSRLRYERLPGGTGGSWRKTLARILPGLAHKAPLPLRIMGWAGLALFAASFGLAGWSLLVKLLSIGAVPDWAPLWALLCAFGGVQLISVSVIGRYLSGVFQKIRGRPRYTVEQTTETASRSAAKPQKIAEQRPGFFDLGIWSPN